MFVLKTGHPIFADTYIKKTRRCRKTIRYRFSKMNDRQIKDAALVTHGFPGIGASGFICGVTSRYTTLTAAATAAWARYIYRTMPSANIRTTPSARRSLTRQTKCSVERPDAYCNLLLRQYRWYEQLVMLHFISVRMRERRRRSGERPSLSFNRGSALIWLLCKSKRCSRMFIVFSLIQLTVTALTRAQMQRRHLPITHRRTHTRLKKTFFHHVKEPQRTTNNILNFKQERVFIYGEASEEVTCHYERVDYTVLVGLLDTLQIIILWRWMVFVWNSLTRKQVGSPRNHHQCC